MDNLEACKICLVQGVRMFPTKGYLDNHLKELLGHKMLYSSDVPPYICYECACLLKKCIKFKEKCLLGQNVLFDILADKNQITKEDLLSVNRIKMDLVSSLMYYPISDDNIHEFEHEEADYEEVEVKEEVLDMDGSAENNPLIKEEIDTSPKKRVHSDGEGDDDDDNNRFMDDSEDSDYKPFPAIKEPPKPKTVVMAYKPRKKKQKKKCSNVQVQPSLRDESWEAGLNIKTYPGSKEEEILEKDFFIKKLTKEEQMRDLPRRKESSNYKDSPFKCDICYRGYLQEETLQNHMVHHALGSGQYECKICILNLKCRTTFIDHMLKHERRYECKQCAYIAEDLDLAKKHKMWHYGVTYKCQYCKEVSKKLSTHLDHMRIKHPSHYICELCGYSFVSAAGLKMHRSRMHREGAADANTSQGSTDVDGSSQDGGLYCKECDLQFASVEEFNLHKVTSDKHSDTNSNECRHCGSVFPNGELLRSHQRLHALNLAVRRMLSNKKTDGRHRTGKYGEGKYPAQCEHCEETIQSRELHWKHYQRIHQHRSYVQAPKNFVCELCGKGFPSNTFLTYHASTHTDELPFKCSTCDKSFHTRSELTAHLKTHEQDRQVTCEVCSKQFKSVKGLQEHVKSHKNERAHPCLYCEKAFTRPQGLALHIKKTHMMMAPPGQGQNGT